MSRALESETLPPGATDRVFRSLRTDAETAEREERRRAYLAARAEEERLRRWRRWAAWGGVPAAVALPALVAAVGAGWGFLDLVVVALDLPWLPDIPVLVAVATLLAAGAAAWTAGRAPSRDVILVTLGAGFALGVLMMFAACELPVYRASRSALLADGSSMAGAILRVEHMWPAAPDRLHVLRGNGRVERGAVLTIKGGRPVAYLRSGG